MDLIEFLFGAKKVDQVSKTKTKKPKPKYIKIDDDGAKRISDAVQVEKTNDILEDQSTEDLQKMEEEIRNKN
jgi:TPP-dependent 2-oxoacid decarboxylase